MAKFLDSTGLDKLVTDYLKPEDEFSTTSEHPVMNRIVTGAFTDTITTINNDKSTGYYHYATSSNLPSSNSVLTNWVYQVGQRAIVDDTGEVYEITDIIDDDITWEKQDGVNFAGGKVNATALADSSEIATAADRIYLNVEDGKIYEVKDGEANEVSKEIDTCLIDYELYSENKDSLDALDILFVITDVPAGTTEVEEEPITIIMGDSYGNYKNDEDKSFIDVARDLLEQDTAHFVDCHKGSAGFTRTGDTKFLNMLQVLDVNRTNVKAIYVFAGANDVLQDYNTNVSSIKEFMTWVKANMPKATVYLGHPGLTFTKAEMINRTERSLKAYREAVLYGAIYLKNSEYVLHYAPLLRGDHVHPNTEGINQLGRQLAQAIKTGECDVHYYSHMTPNLYSEITWGTVVNGDIYVHLDNETFSIGGSSAGLILKISCNSPVAWSLSNYQKLFTMPNSPFIGNAENHITIAGHGHFIKSDGTDVWAPFWLYFDGTYDTNGEPIVQLGFRGSDRITNITEIELWTDGLCYPCS